MSVVDLPGWQSHVEAKRKRHTPSGIDIRAIHPALYDFQAASVKWALAKGRACIFAGTGLGKTLMQAECARHLPGKRLIISPLAVAPQTIREAREKLDQEITRIHHGSDVSGDGVYIANYQRLDSIRAVNWDAVILDESSILKSHDGAYRQLITESFARTPYRFAMTATPAPNDHMELGTHAEFVGAASRMEMLATYFMHDGGETSKWRLKRHAQRDFWQWVASWALCYASPSDIGFDGSSFVLPAINIIEHTVDTEYGGSDSLFGDAANATSLHGVLRESLEDRIACVKEIVADNHDESWIVWCNSNAEQDAIIKALPGIASVRGNDSEDAKEDRLLGFADGKYQMLVTKPTIAGFGMNWQHCSKVIFAGLTYSFEQFYQAVRRCWRYGQTRPVDCHVVVAESEAHVRAAVAFKQGLYNSMAAEMKLYCKGELEGFR